MLDYEKIAPAAVRSVRHLRKIEIAIEVYSREERTELDSPRYKGIARSRMTKLGEYEMVLSRLEVDPLFTRRIRRRVIVRNGRLLKLAGIPINMKSIFTCIVLHELGHLENHVILQTEGMDFSDAKHVTTRPHHHLLSATRLYRINTRYGMSLSYLHSASELFAENFVTRNIQRAWDDVKDVPDIE